MDRRLTSQQALRLCCDRVDAFLSSALDERVFGEGLSALYAEIRRRNIAGDSVKKDDKFLLNEIDDEISVPKIPGWVGRFVNDIATVKTNIDNMRPDKMQRADVPYRNDRLLDHFTENILDFLNHYGYQDELYMHLSETQLSVMNCVVKFSIANECRFLLTVREYVGDDGENPVERIRNGNYPYYNAAHYLERVEAEPTIKPAMVEQDNAFIRLIDIIIAIAVDKDKTTKTKREQIAIKVNEDNKVSCIAELQEYVRDSMVLHHTVHNCLLNWCTVSILSKLLGLTREIAFQGTKDRLVVLSFVVRSLLMRDYSYGWITKLVEHMESDNIESIWELFP